MSADDPSPHREITARIRERIRADGPITFAEFMEAALYGPDEGSYARRPVGEAGDFGTSPHGSPAFGVLLARQIEELWRQLGQPQPFWVVEAGAGVGTLAGQILDFLHPKPRRAIRYVALERSAHARRTLSGLDVLALGGIEEVPPGLVGCLVANELLDNLPFHRLRGTPEGVVELRVALQNEMWQGFDLVEAPVASKRVLEHAPPLQPGQEAVVSLAALNFLDQAAGLFDKGYLWLIDYGSTGGHHRASVHGYSGHRLVEDILSRPGSTDITAGVDFDLLSSHLRNAGHTVWGPVTQRDLLRELGYRKLDEEARIRQVEAANDGRRLEAARIYAARSKTTLLVDPTALGGFLVLCAGIGVDVPPASMRKVG